MNGLDPLAQALAWTLLHFLWQGLLIGALAWAALALLSRRAPALRYGTACVAFGLMALAPVGTFLILLPEGRSAAQPMAQAISGLAIPGPSAMARLQMGLQPWLPWVLLLWCAGAAMLALRLAGGLWMVHRLKTEGTHPAPAEWHLILSRLARALGIRRSVRLLKSARVDVPMVAGWLRPVILLPLSAFSQLSPAQLEAVLAHELAHIRRHDFLVNLLQAAVETLLFYHPAVWWLSRRIREERELCCDDAAVGLCKDALDYARALALLETHRSATPSLVLSAQGGPLMHRISRLIHPQLLPSPRLRSVLFAGLALSALGASAFALQEPPEAKERKAQSSQIVETPEAGAQPAKEAQAKQKTLRRKIMTIDEDGPEDSGESARRVEVTVTGENGKQRIQVKRNGQVERDEIIDAPSVIVNKKDGKVHIMVRRDGKIERDETIEIPKVNVTREGNRQRILIEKGGKVVQENVMELPDSEDAMQWVWKDSEGNKETRRLKLVRPWPSSEVARLKAEVETLRKQVEELQRQMEKKAK